MSTAQPVNRRPAAAVLIVAVLVATIGGGLWFTYSMVQAQRLNIEALQTEYEALRRRAAMPARTGETGPVLAADPYLSGATLALAANSLQQRIVGLIEATGGTLVTVSIEPAVSDEDEAGRRVVVQAVAQMNNDGLQEVLYRIESEAPFAFIDNLVVTRVATRGSDEEEDKTLRVTVDMRVAGYFRKAAR